MSSFLPTNQLLLDFHTHNKSSTSTYFPINSVFLSESSNIDTSLPHTVGIHPWHVSSNITREHDSLLRNLSSKIIAIGEIGLDKPSAKVNSNYNLQLNVFHKQLTIAQQTGLPVVVHCVKAYDDLLKVKREFPSVKMAIHGFTGSFELASSLIQKGFYLSFGNSLLKSPKLAHLGKLPSSRIFLETDTAGNSLGNVYDKAADLMDLNIDELRLLIWENAINFFGNRIFEFIK
ncbi:hypothetical protein P9112_009784 [Eukaryota sp. TZLM1-RC]